MLQIVCLKAGTKYGAEYVNILHDSVRRNLPDGFEGRFVCFTDDASGLASEIEVRPLPHPELTGWWHKLSFFERDCFPGGDRILYLDLDSVITGPLDDIAKYQGRFAILRDFYRPAGLQSSVMAWKANECADIWDEWDFARRPEIDGGDQAWIERVAIKPVLLQHMFPGRFVSYKVHARRGIPMGSSVCVFHGEPRPADVTDGWVPMVWKIGGGTSASLEVVGNTDMKAVEANVRSALARKNVRWLQMKAPTEQEALIVAGGPSLKDELSSLRAHVGNDAAVFAVNNALKFLTTHGIYADGQIILDAREENLSFVPHESHMVDRYYASQCHSSVLDAAGDANLILWHPLFPGILDITGDADKSVYVGGGTTAGLKAIVIAYILGHRRIHLYGFDSSYAGDANHAYPQALNANERIVETIIDGETFRCAPWMITQAEDFQGLVPEMAALGCELIVHGTGLIPKMAEVMARGSMPMPPDIRCAEILKRVNGKPFPKGAEIGVFGGDLSKRLLAQKPDLTLYMVDSWTAEHTDEFNATQDFHGTLTQGQHDYYADLANMVTSFAQERGIIMRMNSLEAAEKIADESLDFAFIDADHSYEGCAADCKAWFPKVKIGGLICGHDYANNEYLFGPMVKRAVDEFVHEKNLTLDLGDNFTWFARREHG